MSVLFFIIPMVDLLFTVIESDFLQIHLPPHDHIFMQILQFGLNCQYKSALRSLKCELIFDIWASLLKTVHRKTERHLWLWVKYVKKLLLNPNDSLEVWMEMSSLLSQLDSRMFSHLISVLWNNLRNLACLMKLTLVSAEILRQVMLSWTRMCSYHPSGRFFFPIAPPKIRF